MGIKVGGCCTSLLQRPTPPLMASSFNNCHYSSSFYSSMFTSRARIARSARSCNLTISVVDNHRSPFLGSPVARHKSLDGTDMSFLCSNSTSTSTSNSLRRSSSASNGFCTSKGGDGNDNDDGGGDYDKNEEFFRKFQELTNSTTKKIQFSENENNNKTEAISSSYVPLPPKWVAIGSMVTHKSHGIERTADDFKEKKNTGAVDLPLMIKKREEEQNITRSSMASSNYYYDSVKKAFSSMVFIIRELHSYTLHLREVLFLEDIDLQGILSDVHKEMHASFCWLFQQIFSCTPTLMLSVMLLLANFTVHSMSITTTNHLIISNNFAMAATVVENQQPQLQEQRSVIKREMRQEAWMRMLESARSMLAETRHEALMDKDILLRMVAPVSIEVDDDFYSHYYPEHFRTELMYQTALKDDPYNTLFLCNYAQFLYLVVHDHDRAEDYFKRAVDVGPVDGECLSRYANFLWVAKKDLCAAEETYLRAIEVDPDNTSLAANYANFLWNTGGEDTCFPLQA